MGAKGINMTDTIAETTEKEYMRPGHMACPGCGEATVLRLVLKVLGEKTVMVILPSCVGVISATYPNSTFAVPCFHSAFEIAAPTASGIAAALALQGREDVTALAFAGDGGTFDIGIHPLGRRGPERQLHLCLSRQRGIHEHGHPVLLLHPAEHLDHDYAGREAGQEKEIHADHRRAQDAVRGDRFHRPPGRPHGEGKEGEPDQGHEILHALTPCPTGWRMAEHLSVRAAQLAVETRLFPLYEITDGKKYKITHEPKGLPVDEYVRMQGRFRTFTPDDVRRLQARSMRNGDY